MGVVPIRPREGEGAFTKNWEQWLAKKGSYSDLADGVIYRPFDNRVLASTNQPTSANNLEENLNYKGKYLSKLSPSTKHMDIKVNSGELPAGAAGMLEQHPYGSAKRATVHVNTNGMGPTVAAERQTHELQHALLDKMDYNYGNRDSDFFDRKSGKIIDTESSPNNIDFRNRSQDEHIARASQNGFKPTDELTGHAKSKGYNVAPEEKIVRIRPKFTQKGSPVYNQMKSAGVKLPGVFGAVLGVSDQARLKQELDTNRKLGKPLEKSYGDWLSGAPTTTYKPENL
jgi:hypothetical protein